MNKKLKRIENDISKMKYSFELVRTIVPVIALVLQVVILSKVL